MQYAYAAADFVVCRSGRDDLRRAAAVGLPAAYVPLPLRRRRAAPQRRADRRAPAAACWSTTRSSRRTGSCANVVPRITDPDRLAAMSAAAPRAGARDADVVLARHVLDVVAETPPTRRRDR